MCVQNFDDSRGLAIRITYRISLRSSSLWEPRHPLLKVVKHCLLSTNSKGEAGAHVIQILGSFLVKKWCAEALGVYARAGRQQSNTC